MVGLSTPIATSRRQRACFPDCVYVHGYSARWGLGRTEGRAAGGEQSTEKGVGRARAERAGVTVVDWSVNWNTSFANRAWSILRAVAYHASGSVSAGHLKGIVAI